MTNLHIGADLPGFTDSSIDRAAHLILDNVSDAIYFQLHIQYGLRCALQSILKRTALSQANNGIDALMERELKRQTSLIKGFLQTIRTDYHKERKDCDIDFPLFLEDSAVEYAVGCMQKKLGLHEAIIDLPINGRTIVDSIRDSFSERMDVYSLVMKHKEQYENIRPKKARPPKNGRPEKIANTQEPIRSMAALNRAIPTTAKTRIEDGNLYIHELLMRPLSEGRIRGVKL